MTLDELRADGESMMVALSREQYLTHSGHKRVAELTPIYKQFAHVTSEDALELVRDAFLNATPGSESHRAARALLEWQAESHASRELAPLDEQIIAWEGSATVRTGDGRTVPYSRVGIEIAAERDRA